ncbi:MAG: hypothetical protein L0H73_11685 [Nitrococcus sp.]|nr:hypothetical protein [Nitrococcus sp.]
MRAARLIEALTILAYVLPCRVDDFLAALDALTNYSGEYHEALAPAVAIRCAWVLRSLGMCHHNC